MISDVLLQTEQSSLVTSDLSMQVLHQSTFQKILFFQETRTIKNIWFESTHKINTQLFKKEMLVLKQAIDTKKPLHVLGDMQNLYFALIPTLQNWVVQNLSEAVDANAVNRYAFVMPEDFLAQLSIEQTIEELIHKSKVHYGSFLAQTQAETWLRS